MDCRISNHAAASIHFRLARLELRLDEQHELTPRSTRSNQVWQRTDDRDEGQVGDDQIHFTTNRIRSHITNVEPLEHGHSSIVTDLGVQLTVPDVEGHDTPGTPLQQAIGEPTGRRARVEHAHARHVDAECLERGVELLPASTDEPGVRSLQDHRVVRIDE